MAVHNPPSQSLIAHNASSWVDRHGYRLPAVYSEADAEYAAAVTKAALHDASFWGRLKVTGSDALDLLDRLSTNKVIDLQPGQAAPTVLTTDRGRIVDLLGVVNTGDHVLLLTSPGRQQAVVDWLDKYTIMEDLLVEDITGETAMLALIGPHAADLLERPATVQEAGIRFPAWEQQVGNCTVLVVERPLGKLPCFYLLTASSDAPGLWRQLVAGPVTPVGAEALDAVRVSQGVPEYGNELGEPYNPLEAGLIGSVDFAKGCYIGQEVIARLDSYNKVQKYLVSLRFDEDAVVTPGTSLTHEGRVVGAVTSLSRIPGAGLVGLGYVRTASALVGGELWLQPPASGRVRIEELAQLFGPGPD